MPIFFPINPDIVFYLISLIVLSGFGFLLLSSEKYEGYTGMAGGGVANCEDEAWETCIDNLCSGPTETYADGGSCVAPGVCCRTLNYCGDSFLDPSEDCDGALLGGNACTDVGFYSGTLACSSCSFDNSSCTGFCGDGTCDDGESCSSCEADCGACSNSGGGGGSSSGGTPFINIPLNGTCQANVTCTDWVDCADGFQTRTCTDNNECLEDSPYTSKRECNSDEEAEPKLDDSGKFGSFELPEEGDNRFIWFGGLGIAFIGFLLYYFKSYKPKQTA